MENPIRIHVPISISYPALEEVIKKKMVGEFIPPGKPEGNNEPPYAQILDIKLTGSATGTNEVILGIKLRILRTVLKRDQVGLIVHASLGYDNATQLLYVRKFKVDSKTPSGFYNTSLEVLANRVAYNKILQKTRFKLGDIISKQKGKVNALLEKGKDLKGVKLSGTVEIVRILDIHPQADKVSLSVELQGAMEADIFDLLSLIPA